MSTLRPYIITRNYDATEWSLTELTDDVDQRRPHIYTDVDGRSMRRVLSFDAPGWEQAREFFGWAHMHLRKRSVDPHLLWDEARILLTQESPHAFLANLAKERPEPRPV